MIVVAATVFNTATDNTFGAATVDTGADTDVGATVVVVVDVEVVLVVVVVVVGVEFDIPDKIADVVRYPDRDDSIVTVDDCEIPKPITVTRPFVRKALPDNTRYVQSVL